MKSSFFMMIISIINFFYLLAPLFIWVEIFGFLNRGKVYKRLSSQNIEFSNLRLYLFFFLSKIIYLIWIPLGFFTNLWFYFMLLCLLGTFRFVTVSTRNNIIINLYDFLNPFLSCIILLIILFLGLFR